jgi:hypothetical protein
MADPEDRAARLAALERVLADPPQVHPGAAGGVFSASRPCYEWLAEMCRPGLRTLETGLGVSTVLLTLWGCVHTSVAMTASEVERLTDHLQGRGIDTSNLSLLAGGSDAVLPALHPDPLDLVLVDGCHAFPFPILDWFYAGRRLVRSGHVVVDDLQLPAPAVLDGYLAADPRWTEVQRGRRWVAYRRDDEGDLREEWRAQPFLAHPGSPSPSGTWSSTGRCQ